MGGYTSGAYAGTPYGAVGSLAVPLPKSTGPTAPQITSGDTTLDASGNPVASDPLLERVKWLLGTLEPTFIAPDGTTRGNSVIQIRAWTSTTPIEVRDRVLRALSSEIVRGTMTDVRVTPNPYQHDGSTAVNEYSVSYTPTGLL